MDDFEEYSEAQGTAMNPADRRLHLKAIDYWRNARGDEATLPAMQALTREGLSPFRDTSMMIELGDHSHTVRYVGADLALALEQPIEVGVDLESLSENFLAVQVLANIPVAADLLRPVEMAAVCHFPQGDGIKYRGVLLPLAGKGGNVRFIYAVLGWRNITLDEDVKNDGALSEMLRRARAAAGKVVSIDGRTRDTLYYALAEAIGFYEESLLAPDDYQRLIKDLGLKTQARAPFTPVLKMIFGKTYDKTRLTEYAAALSYGWRNGQTRDSFPDFLRDQPGGIKGCVAMERKERKIATGNQAADRLETARENLRRFPALDLEAAFNHSDAPDTDFCLLIARKTADGHIEPIGFAGESDSQLDAAIKRFDRQTVRKTRPGDG